MDYPTTDTKHLYLIQPGDILQAYDLDTGRLLWKVPLTPRVFYNLYRDGDALCVHNLDEAKILYLDPDTGAELRRVQIEVGDGVRFLAHFPQFDLHTLRGVLRAVDVAAQQVRWEASIEHVNHYVTRPTLYQDRILLVGDAEIVTAVDAQTGDIKWDTSAQADWFSSNFVVVGDSLYALDYHARLVRRNVETGQETGHIQFTPESVYTNANRYRVAADGQMVFVHFDDSQELIALGP